MGYAVYQGGKITRGAQAYGQGLVAAATTRANADIAVDRAKTQFEDVLLQTAVVAAGTMVGVPPMITASAMGALNGEPLAPAAVGEAMWNYRKVPVSADVAEAASDLGMTVHAGANPSGYLRRGDRDALRRLTHEPSDGGARVPNRPTGSVDRAAANIAAPVRATAPDVALATPAPGDLNLGGSRHAWELRNGGM